MLDLDRGMHSPSIPAEQVIPPPVVEGHTTYIHNTMAGFVAMRLSKSNICKSLMNISVKISGTTSNTSIV